MRCPSLLRRKLPPPRHSGDRAIKVVTLGSSRGPNLAICYAKCVSLGLDS
jgi:hypothetical protein